MHIARAATGLVGATRGRYLTGHLRCCATPPAPFGPCCGLSRQKTGTAGEEGHESDRPHRERAPSADLLGCVSACVAAGLKLRRPTPQAAGAFLRERVAVARKWALHWQGRDWARGRT
jgi:hypothetical protein